MRRQSDVEEPAVIDVGTAKLYHEVRGNGPAVLFISGSGGDAGQWMHVAPALAEKFTVVTYDRRGFSRSPRPDGWTVPSVDEHTDDAAARARPCTGCGGRPQQRRVDRLLLGGTLSRGRAAR